MSESKLIDGELLFDTNAASGLIRRSAPLVAAIAPSCKVVLPLPVVGELLYGAHHAGNPQAQLARVRSFVARTAILVPDSSTAEEYGRIKADLRMRGQMIPENDLWIAAIAAQHGLPVLTRDGHFSYVTVITVATW